MKKPFLLGAFLSLFLFPIYGWSFVPRTMFVLDKWASSAGSGSYSIDYDISFPGVSDAPVIKETWIVDSDQLMKVTALGIGLLKDQLSIQNLYSGSSKTSLSQKGRESVKISDDFFEKFLFIRNKEALHHALNQQRILPTSFPALKVPKNSKDFVYPPETYIRLARVGGTVTYALGAPSKSASELNPGAWLEQDLFYLRKMRLSSKVEMSSEAFSVFPKGLSLPKTRSIRWNNRVATIQLAKVTSLKAAKGRNILSSSSLDLNSRIGSVTDPELLQTVQEFYERFR